MKRISLTGQEVLSCNKTGEPINVITPEKMFGDLSTWQVHQRTGEFIVDPKSGQKFRKMKAYIINWVRNPDGTYDTTQVDYMNLVDWDIWQALEPTDYDLEHGLYVNTGKRKIKIPRVVQVLEYGKMHKKRLKLNIDTMHDLYHGTDPYTGKYVPKEHANLDHVIPKSRGGKRVFENMAGTGTRGRGKKSWRASFSGFLGVGW